MPCPLGGGANYYVVPARFVETHLGHAPNGLEGMDLTKFMHGVPAELVACATFATVRRNEEQTAQYESDPRVPNADCYREAVVDGAQWCRALSYNNLLGFFYLYGYSLKGLKRLLASTGFETIATFPASLLRPYRLKEFLE